MGLEIIVWNRDTLDCKIDLWLIEGTAASSATSKNPTKSQTAFKGWLLEPFMGTISLQHDIDNITVAEIPITLDLLANSSYSTVLISKCANIASPYDETLLVKSGSVNEGKTGDNQTQHIPDVSGVRVLQIPIILSVILMTFNHIS
jgi:hypothetical protein